MTNQMLVIGKFTEIVIPILTECPLTYFIIFTTTLPSRHHIPNFIGKKTEAWGKVKKKSFLKTTYPSSSKVNLHI